MGEEKDPQILGISRDVKVSLRSSIVGKPPSVIRFLIGVVLKALKDDLTAALYVGWSSFKFDFAHFPNIAKP